MIIGKVEEENIIKEFDFPEVKIIVYEVKTECGYSNPTMFFNMTLPHIELKLNYYKSLSFREHVRNNREEEARNIREAERMSAADSKEDQQPEDPQASPEEPIEVDLSDLPSETYWYDTKSVQATILKVMAINKTKGTLAVHAQVTCENAFVPNVPIKEMLLD